MEIREAASGYLRGVRHGVPKGGVLLGASGKRSYLEVSLSEHSAIS